jgi:hypothetical protein
MKRSKKIIVDQDDKNLLRKVKIIKEDWMRWRFGRDGS